MHFVVMPVIHHQESFDNYHAADLQSITKPSEQNHTAPTEQQQDKGCVQQWPVPEAAQEYEKGEQGWEYCSHHKHPPTTASATARHAMHTPCWCVRAGCKSCRASMAVCKPAVTFEASWRATFAARTPVNIVHMQGLKVCRCRGRGSGSDSRCYTTCTQQVTTAV
jgi:hypothetical protein